jgi:hypothetical protein
LDVRHIECRKPLPGGAALHYLYEPCRIRPLEPAFQRCEIRPQLADLDLLELTAHTIKGPLVFSARGKKGNREINLTVPDNCAGELVVRREEALKLEPAVGVTTPGHRRYQLPSGRSTTVQLEYT